MRDAKFSIKFFTEDLVRKETVNLIGSKATVNDGTSVNILKSTVDIYFPYNKHNKFLNRRRLFS